MNHRQIEVPSYFLKYAEKPEEATWTCETCGIVSPQPIKYRELVRFTRAECACQLAAIEAKRKEERWKEHLQWLLGSTYHWLGDRWDDRVLATKTFATFDATKQPEAYRITQAFVSLMKGTFILYGTFGTGKTHLLAAICNALREMGKESRFTTAPQLFAAISNKIHYHEDYTNILKYAIDTPFLVIDDVDKARHSDFREEVYFEIIDARTKHERSTAISTNRLDELADFVGGAVCSRLKIGQIAIEMIGQDYREEL